MTRGAGGHNNGFGRKRLHRFDGRLAAQLDCHFGGGNGALQEPRKGTETVSIWSYGGNEYLSSEALRLFPQRDVVPAIG